MAQTNNLTSTAHRPALLVNQLLLGAGVALILMTLLLSSVNQPNPSWGKLWIIRPLLVVSFAGAGGGVFYYLMNRFWGYKGGWRKAAAITLSLLGYVIALWMGTILGLSGTLWN